ncbi:cysteine protease [Mycoblastus sanguinarius]|nr:cysteine protease [Mycoblastus sanguinarius]
MELYSRSDDISRNNLWRRTLAAFNYGDVLITMGTGKLTQCEEEGMGLAGEHDYAIIDMQEHKDQKLFLVKNPWSEGTVWRGHVYRGNAKVESGQALEGLCRKDKLSASDLKASSLAPGTFWMGLNDVFQSFESIYLNWNPGLFSHREDIHFQWDLSKENSPEGSFGSNPQYEVRSGIGGTVWLLLSRHFSPTIQGRAEGQRSGKSTDIADHGFISLYTFDSDGERVFLSDNANMRGPYVDSPNTLLKLELPAKRAHTVVISEQALPRMKKNFTLSAFSLSSLTLRHAREKYSHSSTHHGVWTPSTAGGNASSSFYHTNPQFSIQLVEQSDVSLLLENPTEEYPVHVKLVWAHGKQIRSITTRDIVGDSGEYRKGFAFAEIRNVQAGIYTVVCSTFEQGQLGRFSLRVGSGSASVVDRVPVESAGRFVSKIRSALFAPGVNRLVTPLTTHRLNRVSASARPRGDTRLCRGTHSPLKLALEYGQGSSKYTLVVSGDDEYDDCHAGLRTLDVDIQPSMCDDQGVFIVVERLGCSGIQGDERVDVELLSDGPVETGTWIEAE